MHARLSDAHHRFQYNVVSLLIDIDRLAEASSSSPLFAVNKMALVSFHEADHGAGDGRRLRSHVDQLLNDAGVSERAHQVRLLCYPRVLGYVFNPLSIYFCYDADGTLTALIYEVRNTFGDMHTYVIPVAEEHITPAGIRQGCAKSFYVSPFMGMKQRYHFRLQAPGDTLRIRILETDENGPSLSACFSGKAQSLSTKALMGIFALRPWQSMKVTVGIHFEAIRLWLKGAKFHHRQQNWTGYSVVIGNEASPFVASAGVNSPNAPTLKPFPVSNSVGTA